MKILLLLFLLAPLAFAQWETLAGAAIGLSITLVALAYAIGMAFGINELQLMAKEELFQALAMVLMLAFIIGGNGLLDSLSTNAAFSPGAATMQEAARNLLTDNLRDTNSLLETVSRYDMGVSREASKGDQCSVLGMGYGVSACGAFSMLSTPFSMAGGIAGFAIGELGSMIKLIRISEAFSLSFLLPLGILLRTFKLTRGAGGFLIALGVSMHIMLPAGVIFNEMLAATFMDDSIAAAQNDPYDDPPVASVPSCNAADTKQFEGGNDLITCSDADKDGSNEQKAVSFYCDLRKDIRGYLYTILMRATLGPVLALLMMITSVRVLSSIAGAEIDVSAISRFV